MNQGAAPAWSRKFDRATLLLAYAAGLGLIFMVVTIAASVVMRYFFGEPMLGVNEIVQLLSLIHI